MKFKIQNEKQFLAKLRRLENIGDILEVALKAAGFIIVGTAQRKAPVKTGNLRNSIRLEVKFKSNTLVVILIIADTEYAVHVEYGTKRQKAQPYMRPAIELNRGRLERVIADIFIRELKRRLA